MKRVFKFVHRLARGAFQRAIVSLSRLRGLRIGEGSYIQRPNVLLFPEFLSIGKNTSIFSNSYITPLKEYKGVRFAPQIEIGNRVYVGRFAYLVAIDSIRIEDGCVLSECVYITDNFHPERGPIMDQPLESKGPVHIGRNCFIGFRACIMPGVSLGEHCVVGANSVVTRSFPAYSMVAGCPAKILKTFSPEAGEWVNVQTR